jgi:hypothetical protein
MRDFSKALLRFWWAMPLLGVQQVVNSLREPSQSLDEAAAALNALSESAEQQLGASTPDPFKSRDERIPSRTTAHRGVTEKDSISDIPAVVFSYVRVPDKLEAGSFNVYGEKISGQPNAGGDAAASRVSIVINLSPPAPIYHLWGIFSDALKPGQEGVMVFLNLPGDLPMAGAFTEWDPEVNVPVLANDSLLTIVSVQRAAGVGRVIGRNEAARDVTAAGGIVIGALATVTGA